MISENSRFAKQNHNLLDFSQLKIINNNHEISRLQEIKPNILEDDNSTLMNNNNSNNSNINCNDNLDNGNRQYKARKVSMEENWSKAEEEKLMNLINIFGARKWKRIAEHFPNRMQIDCYRRYRKLNSTLVKGKWSEDEKLQLLNYTQTYGKNWEIIARLMKTRTSWQIRDKYLKSLDPSLNKQKFSDEEDKTIVKMFKIHGADWLKISACLSNRSPCVIKSRFYSKLRKKYNLSK